MSNMSNKMKKEFGKKIRDLRQTKGITQDKLAERADVSLSYIAMIEGGKRNLTLDFIEKIAKGLDVEIYQLFLFSMKGIETMKKSKCHAYEICHTLNIAKTDCLLKEDSKDCFSSIIILQYKIIKLLSDKKDQPSFSFH